MIVLSDILIGLGIPFAILTAQSSSSISVRPPTTTFHCDTQNSDHLVAGPVHHAPTSAHLRTARRLGLDLGGRDLPQVQARSLVRRISPGLLRSLHDCGCGDASVRKPKDVVNVHAGMQVHNTMQFDLECSIAHRHVLLHKVYS